MSAHREKGARRVAIPKFDSYKPKDETAAEKDVESSATPRRPSPRPESRNRRAPGPAHQPVARRSHQQAAPSHASSAEGALFVLDTAGDPMIRRYGSNDRRHIPEYRRMGSGRLLGARGFFRIDRSRNPDEFFIQQHREGGSLLARDKKTLLAKGIRHSSQPVRVRLAPGQSPDEGDAADDGFLPLRPSRRKRKHNSNVSDSPSGDEGPSYRSIHGKSKPHDHSDSDESYESESSPGQNASLVEDPISAKALQLSRRTRDHPEDIDAWFELADYQDVILDASSSGLGPPTGAEVQSYAEVKVSILEQALPQAQTSSQRETIRLRILQEGSVVWDQKSLSARWDDVMREFGSSHNVWLEYMNFRQTSIAHFEFEGIKELYVQRLQHAYSELKDARSSKEQHGLLSNLIHVFLRATCFLEETGFTELAIAAWQAMFELSLFRPSSIKDVDDDGILPTSFQDFWESEVPRIGEEGAKGWAAHTTCLESDELLESKPPTEIQPPITKDGYRAWAAMEQGSMADSCLPARMMDDSAGEDPFRVVMFADIDDLLIFLPSDAVELSKLLLISAYLVFCKLPAAFDAGDSEYDIRRDSFLQRHVGAIVPHVVGEQATQSPAQPSLSISEQNYIRMRRTTDALFAPRESWFRYLPNITHYSVSAHCKWIRNVLGQLVRVGQIEGLAPYYLALESTIQPEAQKKTAKSLLRAYGSNFDLYLGFAMLEHNRGNITSARNVISIAMGLPTITEHCRFRLGVSLASMELESGFPSRAVGQLCALFDQAVGAQDDDMPTTNKILKARHTMSANRDFLLSSGDPESAIIYATGLAILEYLTRQSFHESTWNGQGDISAAVHSVIALSDDFVSRGLAQTSAHERLLQFNASLLSYHARKGPFKPAFFREQLARCIRLFPQNSIFLALLARRESRLSIEDRVRSLTRLHNCLESHVFAIRYELQTGNAHSASAAFERALRNETCKNHPEVWIAYIRHCHGHKELKSKAKKVFYRALQNCPGSKQLAMEAFATLSRSMNSSELRSVYNTMCSNGLRVHVQMDEFIRHWQPKRETGAAREEKNKRART